MRTHQRLVGVVYAIIAVTLVGLIVLWPDTSGLDLPDQELEPLIDGEIVALEFFEGEPNEMLGLSGEMVRLQVELHSGPDADQTVTIEATTEGYPDFQLGDQVKLARSEIPDAGVEYYVTDFQRLPTLFVLGAIFVLAVVAISRWHGLRALLGLAISLGIVTQFIVPGIITGESPFAVAMVGAVAVMLVTLYLAHGVNEMTTSAVVGTTAALALTVLLASVFIEFGKLTGFSSEEATLARFAVEGLDLKGLVLAGLIIGALGVLDDVTVSQASTVFALNAANPGQTWGELFRRAMTVGRDHIASTVNTLFLAYAGASLALLLLFSTGGLSPGEILNSEVLAEEIIKTVVGSLGLISAVPFTTLLAASVAVRMPPGRRVGGHVHAHTAGSLPGSAGAGGRTPLAPPDDPFGDVPDDELGDDDRAYRSWVRYLREGGAGRDAPPPPEPPDTD
ncbi:MAG TPA: YibE/F family protein [Nitriliruptorales bacterium]